MKFQKILKYSMAVVIFFGATVLSSAQDNYTVQQVQDRLSAQYEVLTDYKVRAKLTVDMPKFRMPGKNIDLAYKRPDQVRVDADGFAAVPRMGVTLMPEQIFSRLTNLTVPENQAAGDSLIIQGTIKPDTADTVEQSSQNPMQNADFQMRLTVDTKRWVISEIKTVRDTSVISSADILYEEYEQRILLPQKVVIRFHVPNSMREREQTGDTPGAMNENSPVDDIENLETIQGRITIDFGRYRVNTGLSDDFFQKQDG